MADAQGTVVLVCANQAWNLVNFRAGLLRALLADGYRVVAAVPRDDRWCRQLAQMGCTVVHLPLDPAGASIARDLRSLFALARLVRRHRPKALLSWTIKPNIYGALATVGTATVAVPNVSGLGTIFIRRSPLTTIAGALYRLAFRSSPVVFLQNADDRAVLLRERIVRTAQCRLLPGSGIDLHHFAPRSRSPSAHGRFVMIARLLADKGVREYVGAARIVRIVHPDCSFRLIGPLGVANRTAIPQEEVAGWIAEGLIDYEPQLDDVRPAIEAADWVVLPSYREGISRVLLEAAAMARPIVTTDVPGCRDIVVEGENGFLAPPRDTGGLADAMLRAVRTDDAGWLRMAQAARRRVEDDYAEDRVIASYRQVLAEIIGGRVQ